MASSPPLPERAGISPHQMNINRELLKLMRPGRIGGNRRCADCDAELTDYGNIWASVDQGCFVCVHCVVVHRALGFRTKSVNMDLWAVDDIARMTSMGNVKVNEIFERYVPSSWHKPTPDADQHQREQWVLAKYKHMYFMLPHYREEGVASKVYQSPASVAQTLPIRLVDYFVVVGNGGVVLDDRVTPASTPEDIEFREEVLDCFPEADSHLGCPLPEHLAQFVFPDGMRMMSHETPPMTFPFVLTNSNGLKMHGAVLHVAEEIDSYKVGGMVSRALSNTRGYMSGGREGAASRAHSPKAGGLLSPARLPTWLRDTMATPERTGGDNRARMRSSHQFQQLYAPKALVLLSHYPFYNLFSQFLQQIYRIALSEAPLPIERYISNFVCEVPLPPQGQVEVSYALPDRTLIISRPPKNRLPLVDFSYRPLFASLSVTNILCIFGLLLTEAKVALCSSHYALLTPAAEGLLSLLFPFVWQGAYIPVMPFNMRDVLEAPVPFLVGIHSRYLSETDSSQRPRGVVFVDLDNDTVDLGIDEDIGAPRRRPHLPEREANKLRQKLNEFSPTARRARSSHSPVAFPSTSFASTSTVAASGAGSMGIMTSTSGMALLTDSTRGGSMAMSSVTGMGGGSIGGGSVGGGGAGMGVGGDSAGVSGGMAFSLDLVDLAFPNNEHLLPISTFSTEQGLTVPSSRSQSKSAGLMARVTNQRLMKKKRDKDMSNNVRVAVRFGSKESTSMLDPTNDVNARDGFSAAEIRAAFLRFFVSIFRGYLAHVVIPTNTTPYPEKLFNKEAFLKSCGHLAETSYSFMNALLDSQIFEKFLEERTADPTQAEVQFFDESIAAKLNRSKTNPIKKDTPFLNDLSDVHNQVYTPPAPSNWGLPDDGSRYAYGLSFPRLNKDRYGTVRWAKRLFKTPDQHRNVSSVNHQRLLNGARFGGRRAKRRGSDFSSTVKPAESYPRTEAGAVVRGIVRMQALYRMHQGKTSFRAKKEAAATISRAWRNWQATSEHRIKLYTIILLVKDIQRVYRGHLARRDAAARLDSVCRLQAWQRMLVLRRRYKKLRRAAEIVQAVARGRNCRVAFLVVRELIILAQAAVRGWIERRVAAKHREVRVGELRTQIFELWIRASTPLVHRSKFWVLFKGGAFLDLAVHEDEALRLWRDLGLVEHHKEHLARVHFNQTFKYVSEWLRTTRLAAATSLKEMTGRRGAGSSLSPPPTSSAPRAGAGGDRKSTSYVTASGTETPPPSRRSAVAEPANGSPVSSSFRSRVLRKRGNGANSGLTSGVLSTLRLSGFRRGSTASLSSPSAASMRGGQTASAARQAAERVMEEREKLYVELKRETEDGIKVSLFSLFGLEKQKKRKRKLADVLWCDHALADASAEVVLSVFRDHMATQHAWVENKRDTRIRADLLCTVQACILSLQRLRDNPPSDPRNATVATAVANLASSIGR